MSNGEFCRIGHVLSQRYGFSGTSECSGIGGPGKTRSWIAQVVSLSRAALILQYWMTNWMTNGKVILHKNARSGLFQKQSLAASDRASAKQSAVQTLSSNRLYPLTDPIQLPDRVISNDVVFYRRWSSRHTANA